jgi:maltose alpha-D-glucosyltransferase/alpha-amylase
LFLKVYRRIEPGVNPEAEIGRFLTEVAHFKNCVPVAGTLDFTGSDGVPTTVALLSGYVEHQGDGFEYSVNYLAQFLEQRATPTTPEPPGDPHGGYLALVHTLGRRTGELHAALAIRAGNPAFDPEVSSSTDVGTWCARAIEEADQVLDQLAAKLATLPPPVRMQAEDVLARRADIATRLSSACAEAEGTVSMRIHGDYHLGQVLLVENDFIIADFEGEPARSLSERRRKQSPLKDVAGMLRSLDYAMHMALDRATTGRADLLPMLTPLAQQWQQSASETFLTAYRTAVASAGLFPNWGSAQSLLQFFMLEKSMYELAYEVENRPAWVSIPLRGIAAALRDQQGSAPS